MCTNSMTKIRPSSRTRKVLMTRLFSILQKPAPRRQLSSSTITGTRSIRRKSNIVGMMGVHVGDPAPLFSLADEQGGMVALKNYYGVKPVVLIFYPGDDTPGCTKQLCAIRDNWKTFMKTGAAVFGVNHADAESHAHFSAKHQLTVPLLIDTDKKVAKSYGAIKKFFSTEVIKRTVVVIGRDGLIAYYRSGMPSNEEILSAIHTS
ncbi:MAG TPA: hypothetical protein DIS62_05455 [Candidatus Kerfeldbacteria bacterium]|nr:hypothetical protein [Candidatus Kerfeldbacteria bacterium]